MVVWNKNNKKNTHLLTIIIDNNITTYFNLLMFILYGCKNYSFHK